MKIKLLIVDDNSLMIDAIRKIFKDSLQISVVGDCSDGSEVLPFLKKNNIDVILMDIRMKKVDGFETIKLIKNYNSKIKIIAFSLIDYDSFIKKVMAYGADGFLSKYETDKEKMEKELNRVMNL